MFRFALVILTLLALPTTTFAQTPKEALAVQGIRLGMTRAEVAQQLDQRWADTTRNELWYERLRDYPGPSRKKMTFSEIGLPVSPEKGLVATQVRLQRTNPNEGLKLTFDVEGVLVQLLWDLPDFPEGQIAQFFENTIDHYGRPDHWVEAFRPKGHHEKASFQVFDRGFSADELKQNRLRAELAYEHDCTAEMNAYVADQLQIKKEGVIRDRAYHEKVDRDRDACAVRSARKWQGADFNMVRSRIVEEFSRPETTGGLVAWNCNPNVSRVDFEFDFWEYRKGIEEGLSWENRARGKVPSPSCGLMITKDRAVLTDIDIEDMLRKAGFDLNGDPIGGYSEPPIKF